MTDYLYRAKQAQVTSEMEIALQEALKNDEIGDARGIKNASGNVVGLSAGSSRVGSIMLLSYANEAGFAALPGSAEQIISDIILIPANTLKPGDVVRLIANTEDAGTADNQARSIRARIHTTAAVKSGNALLNASSSVANNTKMTLDKTASIVSTTLAIAAASGAAGGVISTTATRTCAIDCTVDQYVGFTVQNDNTLVNHLIYFMALILEQAQ